MDVSITEYDDNDTKTLRRAIANRLEIDPKLENGDEEAALQMLEEYVSRDTSAKGFISSPDSAKEFFAVSAA